MLKPGPLSKYYQLAEIFRDEISLGTLKPGSQFPTEDSLCREYEVSRGTVRQAVSLLVQEGLICRQQGRGTFVNSPRLGPTFFTLTSFNEDIRQQQRRPSTQ